MGVFYGMRSNDLPDWREEKAAKEAEKDDAATSEVIEQTAQNQTTGENSGSDGRLFTQDEVNKIVRERLAKERAKSAESAEDIKRKELERSEMMAQFRADLTDHGLPAEEIINTLSGLDLTSAEGLRHAVDDIIELNEIITEYADRYEAECSARASMPKLQKADELRKIFGLE